MDFAPPEEKRTEILNVRLPESVKRELEVGASHCDRTVSAFALTVLMAGLSVLSLAGYGIRFRVSQEGNGIRLTQDFPVIFPARHLLALERLSELGQAADNRDNGKTYTPTVPACTR